MINIRDAIMEYYKEIKTYDKHLISIQIKTNKTYRFKHADCWDDGAPITKQFRRNENAPLYLEQGTIIKGVVWQKQDPHFVPVFDFLYGTTWWSDEGFELIDQISDNDFELGDLELTADLNDLEILNQERYWAD